MCMYVCMSHTHTHTHMYTNFRYMIMINSLCSFLAGICFNELMN